MKQTGSEDFVEFKRNPNRGQPSRQIDETKRELLITHKLIPETQDGQEQKLREQAGE